MMIRRREVKVEISKGRVPNILHSRYYPKSYACVANAQNDTKWLLGFHCVEEVTITYLSGNRVTYWRGNEPKIEGK